MLAYASPEHCCRDVSIAAFFLRLMQNVQDHSLLASQSVADVGQRGRGVELQLRRAVCVFELLSSFLAFGRALARQNIRHPVIAFRAGVLE